MKKILHKLLITSVILLNGCVTTVGVYEPTPIITHSVIVYPRPYHYHYFYYPHHFPSHLNHYR